MASMASSATVRSRLGVSGTHPSSTAPRRRGSSTSVPSSRGLRTCGAGTSLASTSSRSDVSLSSSALRSSIQTRGSCRFTVRACDSGAVQDEERKRRSQQQNHNSSAAPLPPGQWREEGTSPDQTAGRGEIRRGAYKGRAYEPSLLQPRVSRGPFDVSRGGGGGFAASTSGSGSGSGMVPLSSSTQRSSSKGASPQALDTELLLPNRQDDEEHVKGHPLTFGSLWGKSKLHAPLLPQSEPIPGLTRVLGQTAIACMGAYLFGYHLSVVNGPLDSMARDLAIVGNSMAKGLVVSSFLVGAFLGCTFSSTLADGLGRRRAFLATGLPVLLGSSISALAGSLPLMIVGRVLVGVGLGIGSPLPTMYISEIAPPSLRGTLTAVPQVAACLGILLALAAGAYFPGEPQGWRWCFWIGAVPAAALVFLSEYMIESPRWLAQKGMWSEAEKAVGSLQGQAGSDAAHRAMLELKLASESVDATHEVSWAALFSKQYRKLIFIGCGLFALQQLSGINSVFFFSSSIFQKAGITSDVVANMAVGLVNTAAAVLSTYLMDRSGRKTLLIGSFAAMGGSLSLQALTGLLCSAFPSLAWISPPVAIASTLLYVMAFAMGAGPVPGTLLPEIFPTQIRAKGFGLGLCVYWVFNCALGILFLPFLEAVGSVGVNTFFAVMCFGAILFTQRFIIETKGKTLEEIEAAMLHL